MIRVVADLGNSRLKWCRIGPGDRLEPSVSLPANSPDAWHEAWAGGNPDAAPSHWAVASVNPPALQRLESFLSREEGIGPPLVYRSAATVPVRHELARPETAGADRALAVLGALLLRSARGPGLVVSCGTAVTVERIGPEGVWQGGAIAPGLALAARALHGGTAQLPHVDVLHPPHPWGNSTATALQAGLFWGTVGSVRELLDRQAEGLGPRPWLLWTGGDAEVLAPWVPWDGVAVAPDLVLLGLAWAAFGIPPALP